jgi:hypothetical protein
MRTKTHKKSSCSRGKRDPCRGGSLAHIIAHAQAVVPPQAESFSQTYGEWSAAQYFNRGSPSRSMLISPRVPRGCGLRSA